MELGLKGKVAIITGATEGIGKETARVMAQEGAKVAICSRRPAAVEATVTELKRVSPDVLGVPCDVSKPEDVSRLVEATAKQFGRIDILVNNAGTSKRGSFMENDDAVWATDFEMKVFGAIRPATTPGGQPLTAADALGAQLRRFADAVGGGS